MRRRGNNENIITLFSFQDIMASVIGVLFFCVLLMALDIVNKKEHDAGLHNDDKVKKLQQQAQALKQEQENISQEINDLNAKIRQASTSDPDALLQGLKQLQAKLSSRYATMESTAQALAEIRSQANQREQDIAGKEHQLQELQNQMAATRRRESAKGSGPRLTFIIDDRQDSLRPWLLEVTAKSLRVADRDGRGSFMEFRAASVDDRITHFTKWAAKQNVREWYFVILAKPSGALVTARLEAELPKLGFQIGMELLPEDWIPF